jgi:hypothetical protein
LKAGVEDGWMDAVEICAVCEFSGEMDQSESFAVAIANGFESLECGTVVEAGARSGGVELRL